MWGDQVLKFTELEGQGIEGADLPCAHSLVPGKCVLSILDEAMLVCHALGELCKAVTVYLKGTPWAAGGSRECSADNLGWPHLPLLWQACTGFLQHAHSCNPPHPAWPMLQAWMAAQTRLWLPSKRRRPTQTTPGCRRTCPHWYVLLQPPVQDACKAHQWHGMVMLKRACISMPPQLPTPHPLPALLQINFEAPASCAWPAGC